MTNLQNGQKPKIITICQEKGGVGKTTTCAALGAELVAMGNKCLLIDLAPSGNLSSAFGFDINKLAFTSADLFHTTAPLPNLIYPTSIQNLDLIPGNTELSPVPRELYNHTPYETVLKNIFREQDFSRYHNLILDCPPGMDAITVNAIACADLVILPMVCEFFALQTLENMFRLIRLTRQRVNPHLKYRLLITRMDRRAALHEQVSTRIEDHYQNALLKTKIGVDIKLPESQLAGVPVRLYDPESRAVKQYRDLTREILDLIQHKQTSGVPDLQS